ncbi:hypothetical protein RJ641_002663, partial [Dillenia turbinata]
MDSGLSWADIWDSSNDPLPSSSENDKKKKKGKDGKSEKKKWSLNWMNRLSKFSNGSRSLRKNLVPVNTAIINQPQILTSWTNFNVDSTIIIV